LCLALTLIAGISSGEGLAFGLCDSVVFAARRARLWARVDDAWGGSCNAVRAERGVHRVADRVAIGVFGAVSLPASRDLEFCGIDPEEEVITAVGRPERDDVSRATVSGAVVGGVEGGGRQAAESVQHNGGGHVGARGQEDAVPQGRADERSRALRPLGGSEQERQGEDEESDGSKVRDPFGNLPELNLERSPSRVRFWEIFRPARGGRAQSDPDGSDRGVDQLEGGRTGTEWASLWPRFVAMASSLVNAVTRGGREGGARRELGGLDDGQCWPGIEFGLNGVLGTGEEREAGRGSGGGKFDQAARCGVVARIKSNAQGCLSTRSCRCPSDDEERREDQRREAAQGACALWPKTRGNSTTGRSQRGASERCWGLDPHPRSIRGVTDCFSQ